MMKKNRFRSLLALAVFLPVILFALSSRSKALPLHDDELARRLHQGFTLAFATPEGFKETGVFKILGYLEPEVAMIHKITPKPASLKIEYSDSGEVGKFSSIKVICSQVKYYSLTIATATFEFPNCRLDDEALRNNRIRFLDTDEIRLKTEVSEGDILKVFDLYAQARSLRDLRLELKQNRANLGGWFRKGILTVKFEVRGDIKLVSPKVVNFNCDRLTLNRIPLPRNAARSMIANINPVFDSRKTWLNLNIDSINILDGFVETNARINRREG
jgi:hypothetical protein